MQLEVLVTGTGRSGTGFISKALTEAGLPCSHEGLFGPHGPVSGYEGRAESSWMAVPFLDLLEAPVVLVVREPTAVVQSLLGIEFFQNVNSPYTRFAMNHVSGLSRLSPTNAAWKFWLNWNRRAIEYADVVTTLDGDWSEALASVTSLNAEDLLESGEIVGVYNSRERAPRMQAVMGDASLIAEATRFYDDLSI